MLLRRAVIVVAITALAALLSPVSAQAAPKGGTGPTCNLPESDAEALVILNNFYPNRYTWDHTDLTVYVQAQPGISEEYLDAIQAAIATWDRVLRKCFDGLITLTQVDSRRDADIVVHYEAHAGGAVFSGMAVCGAAAATTSWSARRRRPAGARSPIPPSCWAGSRCTSSATPWGWGMPPTCWRAPT